MGTKRGLSRLGTKLVGVSVLGLALAFVIFYTVDSLVLPWLLYSDRFAPFWRSRVEASVQEYQDYVNENQLTVQEALEAREALLSADVSDIYTIIVGAADSVSIDDTNAPEVSYGLTWPAEAVEAEPPGMYTANFSFIAELHEIQCADGKLYVSAADGTLQAANIGRIAGLLLALAGFCAVMVPYIVRQVRRIGELSRETAVLMSGDLNHQISLKGRDELSGLGGDIERLRQSVVARLEGEREAVGANSQLVTSLSHDLRTPLTKLTGYLDILTYRKYRTEEEHDEFLRLASEKAAQLKSLTDQLFASAQVSAPENALEQPPEVVDGAALLGQLLAEQCDDLRREGFKAQPPVFRQAFFLYTRTEDVVRVFDNLFSNLKKYADPASPVDIHVVDKPDTVTLQFRNHIRPSPDCADSHGLGIPTMRELLSRSGGTLEAREESGSYISILTFLKHRELH